MCAELFGHFSAEMGRTQYYPPRAPEFCDNRLFRMFHASSPQHSSLERLYLQPTSLCSCGQFHPHPSLLTSEDKPHPLPTPTPRHITDIREQAPPLPLATLGAVTDLAHSYQPPSWSLLEDIDVHYDRRSCRNALTRQLPVAAPDIRLRALAMSLAPPHPGDWLNATPSRALGLHIPNRDFILCLSYWLGLPPSLQQDDSLPCMWKWQC